MIVLTRILWRLFSGFSLTVSSRKVRRREAMFDIEGVTKILKIFFLRTFQMILWGMPK